MVSFMVLDTRTRTAEQPTTLSPSREGTSLLAQCGLQWLDPIQHSSGGVRWCAVAKFGPELVGTVDPLV